MQVFDEYKNLPDSVRNSVIAIGNFDGVHRGHRTLLERAREIAKRDKKLFGVLTFEPHPRRLFRPDEPPFRITPKTLKQERLLKCNVDFVVNLNFDWEFASQSAESFIQDILIDGCCVHHVVVGYDFCFGQLRKGNVKMMHDAGVPVMAVEKIVDGSEEKLSSSRVRQFLRHGKISKANEILGWEWEIRGTVAKGDQRGRELGYPTANIALDETTHPAYGVYASLVQIEGEERWRPAATNIGIRPMFEVPEAQVETFIFDFDREIYDQEICVRPVQRLRGEAKFDSLEELITQMDKDCENAREILNGHIF